MENNQAKNKRKRKGELKTGDTLNTSLSESGLSSEEIEALEKEDMHKNAETPGVHYTEPEKTKRRIRGRLTGKAK